MVPPGSLIIHQNDVLALDLAYWAASNYHQAICDIQETAVVTKGTTISRILQLEKAPDPAPSIHYKEI
jgi:hypothetical protein